MLTTALIQTGIRPINNIYRICLNINVVRGAAMKPAASIKRAKVSQYVVSRLSLNKGLLGMKLAHCKT